MKRIVHLITVLVIGIATVSAQDVFNKGDRKVGASIGIGTVGYTDKSRATFDQHLCMEWGIASLSDNITVGVGFNVNKNYGGTFESLVAGKYDYEYTSRSYGKVFRYSTNKWEPFDETKKFSDPGLELLKLIYRAKMSMYNSQLLFIILPCTNWTLISKSAVELAT